MTPIFLDILIIAAIALSAFLGWRRGLVLTLCGLLAVFVAYFGAAFVSNTFSAHLAGVIQPAVRQQIDQLMEENLPAILPPAQTGGEEGSAPSDPLAQATLGQALDILRQSALFSGLHQMVEDAVRDGLVRVATTASAAIADYLALQITRTLLFYLTFFLILIAWNLLSHALDLACRLPVLRTFNEAGGLLVGMIKGGLITLAAVWLVSLLGVVPAQMAGQTYLFRLFMNFQLP